MKTWLRVIAACGPLWRALKALDPNLKACDI
jgi:hypothetical protein